MSVVSLIVQLLSFRRNNDCIHATVHYVEHVVDLDRNYTVLIQTLEQQLISNSRDYSRHYTSTEQLK